MQKKQQQQQSIIDYLNKKQIEIAQQQKKQTYCSICVVDDIPFILFLFLFVYFY